MSILPIPTVEAKARLTSAPSTAIGRHQSTTSSARWKTGLASERNPVLAWVVQSQSKDSTARNLATHVRKLLACRRCPEMHPPVVSGGPIVSKVMLVGQAPGDKEPKFGRPFAWTAGRTLFRWFEESSGLTEAQFRSAIYMAAVCRCFPGKKPAGGDRVPSPEEVANCSHWLQRELTILKPELVLPVGKLAIQQFLPPQKLDDLIGRQFRVQQGGHCFDLIPLPHPSGASPWHRMEPGKTLLQQAMGMIVAHPAFAVLRLNCAQAGQG